MQRYGRDYGSRGAAGRQEWNRGTSGMQGRGGPAGGWQGGWQGRPGEEGRFGGGYAGGGYGGGYRGGRGGYDRGMRGGSDFQQEQGMYGAGGYGTAYGGRDAGYAGYGGGAPSRVGARGGRQDSDVRASAIMTENPAAVTPDTSLTEVAQRMKELDVGIIPVVEDLNDRRLRGVITDRDITIRAVAEGKDGKSKVSECMTDDVETVNKNDPVSAVLEVMQRDRVRRVPVTDREGRLVGIIAQADLAVDYAGGGTQRGRRVERTLERISEPARPERGGVQAQGRNAQGGAPASKGSGQGGSQSQGRKSGSES